MSDLIDRQAAIDAIDEVMNNREIDSIRNAILAIRYKISALPNEDDWTKDYVARLKLRGDNPLRCYGDYFDGAKYINIDTSAKNDTRDYGAYWYE